MNHCHHGNYVGNIFTADYMCPMCEDGYNTLAKCSSCDTQVWARPNDRVVHQSGNPRRDECARLAFQYRKHITYEQFTNFRELFATSQKTKDYYSYRIGNFKSKNLHTLKQEEPVK